MKKPSDDILKLLGEGIVIPALPLAIDSNRRLDERRQRALFRYYLDAGAGGVAVAVHTTQFAIRSPKAGLFKPLLQLGCEEFDRFSVRTGKPVVRIAGVTGKTVQAEKEAQAALDNGYDAALLSLAAFSDAGNSEILEHCRRITEIMPVIGFYLQPAVGGRILDIDFWTRFAALENVIAIKIAPFNRYQTLDVLRGVAASGRAGSIALYTGNDDNILIDLLTEFRIESGRGTITMRIAGGLLGHWAVWTRSAVRLLDDVKQGKYDHNTIEALDLAARITDCNSAFFDAANSFRGCIVGLHEVLRRQGLLEGLWTLDSNEVLTAAQKKEIDRVYEAYPELNDDAFVKENIHKWLD